MDENKEEIEQGIEMEIETNRSKKKKKKRRRTEDQHTKRSSHTQPYISYNTISTSYSAQQHTTHPSASNISSDELLSVYAFCTFRSLHYASRTCKWWYYVSSKEKSRKLTYVLKKDVPLHLFLSSPSPLLHHITHIQTGNDRNSSVRTLFSFSVNCLCNLSPRCQRPPIQSMDIRIQGPKR